MDDDDQFYVGHDEEEGIYGEDFGDDEFEPDYDDGGMFMAEMGAGDRSHGGLLGAAGGAPQIAQARDSTESFQVQVDAICRYLASEHGLSLGQDAIDTLVEKSSYLVDIEYKNPLCYVLGCYWTSGGRDMSKERFTHFIENVVRLLDEDPGAAAVLRYGRLWEKQLR